MYVGWDQRHRRSDGEWCCVDWAYLDRWACGQMTLWFEWIGLSPTMQLQLVRYRLWCWICIQTFCWSNISPQCRYPVEMGHFVSAWSKDIAGQGGKQRYRGDTVLQHIFAAMDYYVMISLNTMRRRSVLFVILKSNHSRDRLFSDIPAPTRWRGEELGDEMKNLSFICKSSRKAVCLMECVKVLHMYGRVEYNSPYCWIRCCSAGWGLYMHRFEINVVLVAFTPSLVSEESFGETKDTERTADHPEEKVTLKNVFSAKRHWTVARTLVQEMFPGPKPTFGRSTTERWLRYQVGFIRVGWYTDLQHQRCFRRLGL